MAEDQLAQECFIQAIVVREHFASDDTQLNLRVNEIVYVLEQDETGWWGGHKEGEEATGWFPGSCVRPMPTPDPEPVPAVHEAPLPPHENRDGDVDATVEPLSEVAAEHERAQAGDADSTPRRDGWQRGSLDSTTETIRCLTVGADVTGQAPWMVASPARPSTGSDRRGSCTERRSRAEAQDENFVRLQRELLEANERCRKSQRQSDADRSARLQLEAKANDMAKALEERGARLDAVEAEAELARTERQRLQAEFEAEKQRLHAEAEDLRAELMRNHALHEREKRHSQVVVEQLQRKFDFELQEKDKEVQLIRRDLEQAEASKAEIELQLSTCREDRMDLSIRTSRADSIIPPADPEPRADPVRRLFPASLPLASPGSTPDRRDSGLEAPDRRDASECDAATAAAPAQSQQDQWQRQQQQQQQQYQQHHEWIPRSTSNQRASSSAPRGCGASAAIPAASSSASTGRLGNSRSASDLSPTGASASVQQASSSSMRETPPRGLVREKTAMFEQLDQRGKAAARADTPRRNRSESAASGSHGRSASCSHRGDSASSAARYKDLAPYGTWSRSDSVSAAVAQPVQSAGGSLAANRMHHERPKRVTPPVLPREARPSPGAGPSMSSAGAMDGRQVIRAHGYGGEREQTSGVRRLALPPQQDERDEEPVVLNMSPIRKAEPVPSLTPSRGSEASLSSAASALPDRLRYPSRA